MSKLNLQPNDSFEPNLSMPILGVGLCSFGQEGGGFVIPSAAQFAAAQAGQAAAAAAAVQAAQAGQAAAAAAVQAAQVTSEAKK